VTDVAAASLERLQTESDMVLLRAVNCILSAQRFIFCSVSAHLFCLHFSTFYVYISSRSLLQIKISVGIVT